MCHSVLQTEGPPETGKAETEDRKGPSVRRQAAMEEREEPHPGQHFSLSSATTALPYAGSNRPYTVWAVRNEPGKASGESASRLGALAVALRPQQLFRHWSRPKQAKSACISDTFGGPAADVLPVRGHAHSLNCLPARTTQRGPATDNTVETDDKSTSYSFVMETASLPTAGLPSEHGIARCPELRVNDEDARSMSLEYETGTVSGDDHDDDPYGWEAELKRRESCSNGGLREVKDGKMKSLRRGFIRDKGWGGGTKVDKG